MCVCACACAWAGAARVHGTVHAHIHLCFVEPRRLHSSAPLRGKVCRVPRTYPSNSFDLFPTSTGPQPAAGSGHRVWPRTLLAAAGAAGTTCRAGGPAGTAGTLWRASASARATWHGHAIGAAHAAGLAWRGPFTRGSSFWDSWPAWKGCRCLAGCGPGGQFPGVGCGGWTLRPSQLLGSGARAVAPSAICRSRCLARHAPAEGVPWACSGCCGAGKLRRHRGFGVTSRVICQAVADLCLGSLQALQYRCYIFFCSHLGGGVLHIGVVSRAYKIAQSTRDVRLIRFKLAIAGCGKSSEGVRTCMRACACVHVCFCACTCAHVCERVFTCRKSAGSTTL